MAFNFIPSPSTLGFPSPLPTQRTLLMNELAQQFGFSFLNESWFPQLLTLIGAVIVINIGAYYLLRHIEKIAARTASAWDDALIKAIRKPLTLILGFSLSGVLAFGGIGGIAVGFAAKDMLANFFGGLAIYLDRPFIVGEWIRSPDHEIEGTVEHIGWRQTRVRAFNKNPIYVPNSLFSTIVVETPTRTRSSRTSC